MGFESRLLVLLLAATLVASCGGDDEGQQGPPNDHDAAAGEAGAAGGGTGGVGGTGGTGGTSGTSGIAGADSGTENVCPTVEAFTIVAGDVLVGESVELGANVTDPDGAPAPLTHLWTSTGGTLTSESAAAPTLTCTVAGSLTVTLAISDGACGDEASTSVTCVDPPPLVKLNEVESDGGVPGDWAELYNGGSTAADVSGWQIKDADDTHVYIVGAGTVVPPAGYLVIDEAALGFALDAADSVRIFDAAARPIDAFDWTAHAGVTYGRCPDGTGAFTVTTTSTKGAANDCAPYDSVPLTWPGENDVQTVDELNVFGGNLSGLTYEPSTQTTSAVLWAVRNDPSTLYRLLVNGAIWTPDGLNSWSAGKTLRYPGGTGNPDSEGVTKADYSSSSVFVAAERNNSASGVSRMSVLRFDTSAAGSSLTATMEWDLTSSLPLTAANLGIEAITWVSDSYLVSKGFFDELADGTYDAANYPDHGSGLFFVGLESNGTIYAFALNQTTGASSKIATMQGGLTNVRSLEFDRDIGYLWVGCAAACGNQLAVLDIDTDTTSATLGRFRVRRHIASPSTLPNASFEGIAFAPESECTGVSFRAFFWADDGATGGHSLRADSIPCGPFL